MKADLLNTKIGDYKVKSQSHSFKIVLYFRPCSASATRSFLICANIFLMKEIIESLINRVIDQKTDFVVEHPADLSHGDYSTNVAMVLAKKEGKNPREMAEEITEKLRALLTDGISTEIESVEIAGPGFINFHLSQNFFQKSLHQILEGDVNYGRNKKLEGKHVVIEYTDPNPFKQFHIGHLMSNAIGEAMSRVIEYNGAKVTRLCYQGDVGPHVAKGIWAMKKTIETDLEKFPNNDASLTEKTKFLGDMYVLGERAYSNEEGLTEWQNAAAEIDEINKQIYKLFDKDRENDDLQLRELYEKGRNWSLQHFDEIYAKLGTNFSQCIYESTTAPIGSEIVRENVPEVFELSDGAIVYKGEKKGLHTRVFMNSLGLTTYEAKDIGLAYYKESEITEKHGKFDASVIITANEQTEYFKVVLAAIQDLKSEIYNKTKHIAHGMMKFTDGKMSSRKGNVITGESLLEDIENMVADKIADRGFEPDQAEDVKSTVAVGAIKYTILKQAIGRDIAFDPEKSISFEGNSGPYLQYTYTRAKSVLDKAVNQGIDFIDAKIPENWNVTNLEKVLYQFPEIIEKSFDETAPQYIATFAINVASEFNSFYGNTQILNKADIDGEGSEQFSPAEQAYKVALTKATMVVLQNALKVLGIKTVERM
jgi:arginyl-tRNA synthetase